MSNVEIQDLIQENLIIQTKMDDAYYRSIIENNSFYIIKTDLQGRYTYLNPFFCKMLSLKAEEWIGKESLSLILPVDHAICVETVEKCLADPSSSFWVILRKPIPGGILSTQWEFKILADENGDPFEFLCIGHDITPLIIKQEELQNLVDVTAEQNKRLINFTYVISHNIRSHVANIIGILNISDEMEDSTMAMDMIKESTNSLDQTLHNLNEVISIQANTSLPTSQLNIYKEINRVIDGIQILITEANVKISYLFDTHEVLTTNPAYFESILLNLFTNALKYKSLERIPEIEINMYLTPEHTVLTFRDNGIGIDMEKYRSQLFGMYKTFHRNTDARGLGLYIIKAQIEAMKGKIEVESEVQVGTIFKLYFKRDL